MKLNRQTCLLVMLSNIFQNPRVNMSHKCITVYRSNDSIVMSSSEGKLDLDLKIQKISSFLVPSSHFKFIKHSVFCDQKLLYEIEFDCHFNLGGNKNILYLQFLWCDTDLRSNTFNMTSIFRSCYQKNTCRVFGYPSILKTQSDILNTSINATSG